MVERPAGVPGDDEVSRTGGPVPPRPDGVPPEAVFSPDDGQWFAGQWFAAQWDAERGSGARLGLCRFWRPDGELVRLEYHRGREHVAIADRMPGHVGRGNPLLEAALNGDEPAIAVCLSAGLGRVRGVALHAAYLGLPALARRLSRQSMASTATAWASAWPEASEARRPGNVDPGAAWVPGLGSSGGWLLGTMDPVSGEAVGSWRAWHAPMAGDDPDDLAAWERVDFAGGRPVRRLDFHGFRLPEGRDRAQRVHVDGFPLYEEIHYGSGGAERLRRRFNGEPGRLDTEVETRDDDIMYRRSFHTNGRLRCERVEQDGTLLHEHWWAPDGTHTAEVLPAADPAAPTTVELWRGLDGGRVVVEGPVGHDGRPGGPVGPWRLLDTGDTVSFKPLTDSSFGLDRRHDLTDLALALRVWQHSPWPAALAGVDEVDWPALGTFFGSAEHFPFLLKGLSRPEPVIFDVALGQLVDPVLHQGTIEEAAGPVVRFAVAVAPHLVDDDLRAKLLGFIAGVATRGGRLGAAAKLKAIHRQRPADATDAVDVADHFADSGVEPAYHEVYAAISDATEVWADLATRPDPQVRRWGLILLAVADGEPAAAALRRRVTAEADRVIRAEGLLGLALHGLTDRGRALLGERIAGPDSLLAFCAALTWLRLRAEPSPRAVDLMLAALRGRLDTAGFERVYLGSGSAPTDAATTLALLPPEQAARHLPSLCAVLDEVDAVNAIAVARALLDIVFPDGYDKEQPLSGQQRRTVETIATSHTAWRFNANLHEVLRYNALPTDRDALRALAVAR
jgi:hypothetical protein